MPPESSEAANLPVDALPTVSTIESRVPPQIHLAGSVDDGNHEPARGLREPEVDVAVGDDLVRRRVDRRVEDRVLLEPGDDEPRDECEQRVLLTRARLEGLLRPRSSVASTSSQIVASGISFRDCVSLSDTTFPQTRDRSPGVRVGAFDRRSRRRGGRLSGGAAGEVGGRAGLDRREDIGPRHDSAGTRAREVLRAQPMLLGEPAHDRRGDRRGCGRRRSAPVRRAGRLRMRTAPGRAS